MNMDRTTVIGMVLLAILFFMFFWYTNKQQQGIAEYQKHIADSTKKANDAKIKPADKIAAFKDSLQRDTAAKISAAGNFTDAAIGTETLTVIETDLIKATFSNKGGSLKSVQLKQYKGPDSLPVLLSGGDNDKLGYTINTAPNQSAETSTLFFGNAVVTKNGDSAQTISYTINGQDGQSITHQYTIRNANYMIDWNILLNGADKLLTSNAMNLHWDVQMHLQQVSHAYEVQQSRFVYYESQDGFDYSSAASGTSVALEQPTNWFGFKQQFFNTSILSKDKFVSGNAQMTLLPDTLPQLFNATATMKVQLPASATANVPLQLYYGPNEYETLLAYNNGMENVVDLGSGIFSFVKYINRWAVMPVFNFFASFINSFGWVIALLTLLIRGVTSPLTYKSYLSGAKMRVLKPELDALKLKFGSDQQGFAMEQMKLFREAGVNPLGGCMPALLQIPIFFALYSFFSSNIGIRGQSFLWVKDLSSYDVLVHLPFTVPFNFGDHISLFTLTAVATSFLISIYNMSMTPTQDNPAMKYMPYIFPFILLFVFNRLPSALTWYYTVSNIITLGIQFTIQTYIIDHDKILAQIEAKRKAPKKVSKFQERYGQMMESQKKLQDLKEKTKGKK
ncbi:membrane protein insertase YidC [Limnovirga soli]|uniref:Membrane protein insertase YidC n=1 Tax=Limnovirga soli TaxID=2656915 RepID=A0A8J8FEB6_9BACT|nr:membrane protein insertase YidC [Limnovirga soli]NNV56490.1 membrane protein insertase YidC [Limnovirga soli]